MRSTLYTLVSVELMFFAILWAIYAIFRSFGTECFNMVYAYITIIAFMTELLWDHFVQPELTRPEDKKR